MKFITAVLKKLAITYSPTLHRSTIGASGLNFSVRDGKRWYPAAIVTYKVFKKSLTDWTKFRKPSDRWLSSSVAKKAFGQLVPLG